MERNNWKRRDRTMNEKKMQLLVEISFLISSLVSRSFHSPRQTSGYDFLWVRTIMRVRIFHF